MTEPATPDLAAMKKHHLSERARQTDRQTEKEKERERDTEKHEHTHTVTLISRFMSEQTSITPPVGRTTHK